MSGSVLPPMVPFFPSSGGPLVSILIPTRTRKECRLYEVVKSCVELISDPRRLEIVVKVDNDDYQALELVNNLRDKYKDTGFRTVLMDKGSGYLDLHLYVNAMAGVATGDWLFLLGDNTCIKTERWEKSLEEIVPFNPYVGIQDVCLLYPSIQGFPLLRRKAFQILGHLTLSPGWDMWLDSIFRAVGCTMGASILVEHFETEKDQVSVDEQRRRRRHAGGYWSSKTRHLLLKDATTLMDYLESFEKNAPWSKYPMLNKWHIWRDDGGVTLPAFVTENHEIVTSLPQLLDPQSGMYLPMV